MTSSAPRRRPGRLGGALLWYAGLTAVAVLTVFPLAWTLLVSLKPTGPVFAFPPDLGPWPLTGAHYRGVWETLPLPRYTLNTVLIAGLGVGLTLVVCSLAAYPLARMRFPGRTAIFYAILAMLMLPEHVGLIVNFLTMMKLHLVDTYAAVYLPSVASIVGIFLIRQAYLMVPRELEDAARIDGAGELTIWWRIMLLLAAPALATLAIFQFVAFWNSFLWPIIVLKTPDKYPLAAGLLYLRGVFAHNTRYIAAGTVLASVPVIVLFLFTQRYFMRGLTLGAIR
ncbi:MAG: carbohydrate ABC transporter permease [Armatimonadota bacterium]|nr:carbohydrate ABC transporter permease [Armatimonadota bacterium]